MEVDISSAEGVEEPQGEDRVSATPTPCLTHQRSTFPMGRPPPKAAGTLPASAAASTVFTKGPGSLKQRGVPELSLRLGSLSQFGQ